MTFASAFAAISSWLQLGLFEAIYVCLPGMVIYRLLRGSRLSAVQWFCVGMPIGFAVCVLAYIGSKVSGNARLFHLYPIPFAGVALVLTLRSLVAGHVFSFTAGVDLWRNLFPLLLTAMTIGGILFVEAYLRHPLPAAGPQ